MKVVEKYFNEELGVFVSVLATRKARPTERTWPMKRGSISYNGHKVAELKNLGYSKAQNGGR
jgi:hypothetical protein